MNGQAAIMSNSATLTLTGGEAIVEILERAGVGPMFGMGGFQLLPFYDAVRRKGMQHFLISDERVGCFAADSYARRLGRSHHGFNTSLARRAWNIRRNALPMGKVQGEAV